MTTRPNRIRPANQPASRVAVRLAHDAGRRARAAGETHLANPYDVSADEYEVWLVGWSGREHPRVETFLGNGGAV